MTFQAGDKVEIIGGNAQCVHIGQHTTIIGQSSLPEHLDVDLPPSPSNNWTEHRYAAFRPHHLRHIPYDGNQASSWEECAFKPKELVT